MTDQLKEILNELSKDQLIYLIEQYYHSQRIISQICVDESKHHITSEKAVEEIRNKLFYVSLNSNTYYLQAYLDKQMGKITVDEYRKILGLD